MRKLALTVGLFTMLGSGAAVDSSPATIEIAGSVVASDLSGPLSFTIPGSPPVPLFAPNSLDSGVATATSIDGFTSLAGVDPMDLTITFGDIERLSTIFTPGGCTPMPPPGFSNCATTSHIFGEGDAGPNFFDVALAGTGTILSGEIVSFMTTTDTDPLSPDFATATGSGAFLFSGGLSPYLDEVLALSGGTGLAAGTLDTFDAFCLPGADPCTFTIAGALSFVPEPSTGLLLATGLLGLALRRRSR